MFPARGAQSDCPGSSRRFDRSRPRLHERGGRCVPACLIPRPRFCATAGCGFPRSPLCWHGPHMRSRWRSMRRRIARMRTGCGAERIRCRQRMMPRRVHPFFLPNWVHVDLAALLALACLSMEIRLYTALCALAFVTCSSRSVGRRFGLRWPSCAVDHRRFWAQSAKRRYGATQERGREGGRQEGRGWHQRGQEGRGWQEGGEEG